MRLFDLVLALAVLAGLVLIARQEFPSYDSRALAPPPAASPTVVASPSAGPPAATSP